MDILGWISIAIVCTAFLIFILVAWMQDPEDKNCECKPAKFCSQCGKKLSEPEPEPEPENLM